MGSYFGIQAPELTIDGVPCRKLGDIKNGETKTFQIDNTQLQIFVIVDKASKDYCNATLTVPEGQEDVSYSGVHKFVFGSNPFCNKEEMLSSRSKNKKTGCLFRKAAVE